MNRLVASATLVLAIVAVGRIVAVGQGRHHQAGRLAIEQVEDGRPSTAGGRAGGNGEGAESRIGGGGDAGFDSDFDFVEAGEPGAVEE